jgi:hypothetical protein
MAARSLRLRRSSMAACCATEAGARGTTAGKAREGWEAVRGGCAWACVPRSARAHAAGPGGDRGRGLRGNRGGSQRGRRGHLGGSQRGQRVDAAGPAVLLRRVAAATAGERLRI